MIKKFSSRETTNHISACFSMLYLEEDKGPRTLSPAKLEQETQAISPSQVTFKVPFHSNVPGGSESLGQNVGGGYLDGILGCFKPVWALVKTKPVEVEQGKLICKS